MKQELCEKHGDKEERLLGEGRRKQEGEGLRYGRVVVLKEVTSVSKNDGKNYRNGTHHPHSSNYSSVCFYLVIVPDDFLIIWSCLLLRENAHLQCLTNECN